LQQLSEAVVSTRFVLVETSHPGNIGAAARALKTMGLRELYLVRPRFFPDPRASARASGADDLLSRAVVCDSLAEALAGAGLVFGTSARERSLRWPEVAPRQCAEQIAAAAVAGASSAAAAGPPAALVFGRERTGLDNDELALCQRMLRIPANPEYSSLNLAAAVQLLAYELRVAGLAMAPGPDCAPADGDDGDPLAGHDDVARLHDHLRETLIELEFLDPGNPRQLMRRLQRLFNRAQLRESELNILRGVLGAAQRAVRRAATRRDG